MATNDPVAVPAEPQSLSFTSGGYTLYTPPTPFSVPPEPARFVLLDDLNDTFYSVDYTSPNLLNTVSWTTLALHTIPDPAIVFPPKQWSIFLTHNPNTWPPPIGFLVSVKSRSKETGDIEAVKIGAVSVQVIATEFMNWGALESLKGEELPKEMRNGLLRTVFNRRPRSREGEGGRGVGYVTLGGVVDGMPRHWHLSGEALNWELDQRFTGGVRIDGEQRWKLFAE